MISSYGFDVDHEWPTKDEGSSRCHGSLTTSIQPDHCLDLSLVRGLEQGARKHQQPDIPFEGGVSFARGALRTKSKNG